MARVNNPAAEAIYAAAQHFVEVALRSDDSLFTPGRPIWTTANIDELYRRLVEQPDEGSGSFEEKLRQQLASAPPEVYQLAGELIYLHLLVIRETMGPRAKRRLITTVLGWSPAPVTIPPKLDAALDGGLARVGIAFVLQRYFQLAFLLAFARAWKRLPATERERLLADPWDFKEMLSSFEIKFAAPQREALLHLVHPDTFEPIVSREHKQRFAREYADYIAEPTNDVDRQLWQIRHNYERRHAQPVNFYALEHAQVLPAVVLPRTLGTRLRPYVQLVAHLDDRVYTPQQIVERLGRISPPIAALDSAPDPAALVRELHHLRLLERVGEDDGYRRWPHLADATEAHMLRYAALTLLVPREDGTWDLPALRAPFDGRPHPTDAWPYGEALLEWYAEAGLAQRNDDATWQALPDALEPLNAATLTARALNTFLEHLRRVRAGQADPPPIADDALPLLDPVLLDERIGAIQRELLIDRTTILRIYRALIAGHHVILSGPPGTGKTHLAQLLPQVLWQDSEPAVLLTLPADPALPPTEPPIEQQIYRSGYAVDVVTATEDWGVRHVIGGIVPRIERNGRESALVYSVRHGCLTRAVLANYSGYDGMHVPPRDSLRRREIVEDGRRYRGRWLIIDEFTRAPIDAAFGSLLTTLGGQRNPLLVPTDDGEVAVPMPRDFRIIGTLNSFDRHFLNQISEAMKRRFTFIDVLPPGRELEEQELAMAVYRALLRLSEQGLIDMLVETERGEAVWESVLSVTRVETPGTHSVPVSYRLDVADDKAQRALADFWRLFRAVRVYRQLGTAQAESLCSAMFVGQSIGMDWAAALDTALADTLADQLQVLTRDEQRVLLAYIEHAADAKAFTQAVRKTLEQLPGPRQLAHLARLRAADPAPDDALIDDTSLASLTTDQLARLFDCGAPLLVQRTGLFARRLEAFIHERGL